MTIRSKLRFVRPLAAAAAAGSLIAFGSSLAQAEAMLSPGQVAQIIESSGYEVLGPVVRHGSTYVADVVGEGDISEQFVVDAHDGRLLHRYRTNSAARRHAPWPSPTTGLPASSTHCSAARTYRRSRRRGPGNASTGDRVDAFARRVPAFSRCADEDHEPQGQ